jgi:hypothetical protein
MKYRAKYSLCLVVLTLTCAVHASDDERRDGNWWTNTPETVKYFYVVGFFDGMVLGHRFSYWEDMKEGQKQSVCAGSAAHSYETLSTQYLSNVTSGQLVAGLDDFYHDYRNRTILLPSAVWLVLNQISGKPKADMEKMIESFRKNANNE